MEEASLGLAWVYTDRVLELKRQTDSMPHPESRSYPQWITPCEGKDNSSKKNSHCRNKPLLRISHEPSCRWPTENSMALSFCLLVCLFLPYRPFVYILWLPIYICVFCTFLGFSSLYLLIFPYSGEFVLHYYVIFY